LRKIWKRKLGFKFKVSSFQSSFISPRLFLNRTPKKWWIMFQIWAPPRKSRRRILGQNHHSNLELQPRARCHWTNHPRYCGSYRTPWWYYFVCSQRNGDLVAIHRARALFNDDWIFDWRFGDSSVEKWKNGAENKGRMKKRSIISKTEMTP